MTVITVPAQPGFFSLSQGDGGGLMHDEPIIAWLIRYIDDDDIVVTMSSKAVVPSGVTVDFFIDPVGKVHDTQEEQTFPSLEKANIYFYHSK